MKSCCFFGHAMYGGYKEYREAIKSIIVELIEKYNVGQFYSGGRGEFDSICSDIVGELREIYPHIKNTLVYSYIPKGEDYGLAKKFTDSVYLLEKWIPPKYAILKTNEMMVDKSDFVIGFVHFTWGGAHKAMKYAEKRKKITLNMYIFCGQNNRKDIHAWIEKQNPERKMKAYIRLQIE